MCKTMMSVSDVKLEQVAMTSDQVTFSVLVDGKNLGTVGVVKYYEPMMEVFGRYVAVWAGPTLCVIDRGEGALRCIDRDDETHRIHPFENVWIVQGELNIDLFDPELGTMLATYNHNEVITNSFIVHDLVHVEDFASGTLMLDPRRSLQVVAPVQASTTRDHAKPDLEDG